MYFKRQIFSPSSQHIPHFEMDNSISKYPSRYSFKGVLRLLFLLPSQNNRINPTVFVSAIFIFVALNWEFFA